MLKHLTAFIVLTCSTILLTNPEAKAQESFKKHLIGGNVSFSTSKRESNPPGPSELKDYNFSFHPTYARYLNDHFAIGVMLGYAYIKHDIYDNYRETSKLNSYVFSPYVRFDIPLWQSRFGIYNNVGTLVNYGETKYKSVDQKTYTSYVSGIAVYYEPGLMFRVKSNVLLQASMGSLLSYHYSKNGNSTLHSLDFRGENFGTNDLRIGINFLL
jgi:hypothetical protein